jgi:hypothetical protein
MTKVRTVVVGGTIIGAWLAFHGTTGVSSVATLLSTAAVPAGGSYTVQTWAPAFLHAAGEPVTACNVAFVIAWENAEGGNWQNSAAYNPLNSTQTEPGSHSMNSANVQAYTSWQQGLQADAATIRNGRYTGILSVLNAGNDAQQAANAVAGSPWGTGRFTASC